MTAVASSYLLDTNAVVAVLRGRPAVVRERLRRARDAGSSLALPAVALFELEYGVALSGRPVENARRLRAFLSGDVAVLPFAEEDTAVAGRLRASLRAAGTPIGPYDLLIAAGALRTRATLVTANVSEFARVPGLAWEDWTAPAA